MFAVRSRNKLRRAGAGLTGVALALAAVGLVNADIGTPTGISVTASGLTVHASGTWSWPAMAEAAKLSYVGFAIDWGDVTTGNAVGAYHVGDGTDATNEVIQPTEPAQGTSGIWGPVSHTYAGAGTYTVCVIIYDLGEVKPFKATGWHSLRAGGTDRNKDNSVEQDGTPPTSCETVDVSAGSSANPTLSTSATPSAFQSFEGATGEPISTPPSTATGTDAPRSSGSDSSALLLLALSASFGLFALGPLGRRRRRERQASQL